MRNVTPACVTAVHAALVPGNSGFKSRLGDKVGRCFRFWVVSVGSEPSGKPDTGIVPSGHLTSPQPDGDRDGGGGTESPPSVPSPTAPPGHLDGTSICEDRGRWPCTSVLTGSVFASRPLSHGSPLAVLLAVLLVCRREPIRASASVPLTPQSPVAGLPGASHGERLTRRWVRSCGAPHPPPRGPGAVPIPEPGPFAAPSGPGVSCVVSLPGATRGRGRGNFGTECALTPGPQSPNEPVSQHRPSKEGGHCCFVQF